VTYDQLETALQIILQPSEQSAVELSLKGGRVLYGNVASQDVKHLFSFLEQGKPYPTFIDLTEIATIRRMGL
jgi:hypothetical protein